MCLETPGVTLDAGPGFAGYTWRDDQSQVVGSVQTLVLDGSACGRTYTVDVSNADGCTDTTALEVQCEVCTPPEVSPAGSPVPLRMDVDGSGTIEFELQPEPDVTYNLYHAADVKSYLAGDWTNKFCDLANGTLGTWTPVDANTVRWVPLVPPVIFEGYWVAVAERLGLEGSYGVMSGGLQRTPDTDGAGSESTINCP
jgi:hypothetical protein